MKSLKQILHKNLLKEYIGSDHIKSFSDVNESNLDENNNYNQNYLYHGTSLENAINILKNGFTEDTYWGNESIAKNYANSYDNPVLIKLEKNDIINIAEPNYTLISFYDNNSEYDNDYLEAINAWNNSNQTTIDSLSIFDSIILPINNIKISKENIIKI